MDGDGGCGGSFGTALPQSTANWEAMMIQKQRSDLLFGSSSSGVYHCSSDAEEHQRGS